MSHSTSNIPPIINDVIDGQVVGSWVVVVHPTGKDIIYGGFLSKEQALDFGKNFMDTAQVSISPVYWPAFNRG